MPAAECRRYVCVCRVAQFMHLHVRRNRLAISHKPAEQGRVMAARVAWKGSLKLRLIAIPIRVFPATSASADVSFRQLHRRCHTPIQLKKWCPHCEEEVSADDVVRGYESSKGEYIVVEEDEIARLRPEATQQG